jgi:hypothetical protein
MGPNVHVSHLFIRVKKHLSETLSGVRILLFVVALEAAAANVLESDILEKATALWIRLGYDEMVWKGMCVGIQLLFSALAQFDRVDVIILFTIKLSKTSSHC